MKKEQELKIESSGRFIIKLLMQALLSPLH